MSRAVTGAARGRMRARMKFAYAVMGGSLGFIAATAVTCYAHPQYGCVGRSCGGNAAIAGLTEGGPLGGIIGALVGLALAMPRFREQHPPRGGSDSVSA